MKKISFSLLLTALLCWAGNADEAIQLEHPRDIQINPQESGDNGTIGLGDQTIDVVRSLGNPKGQMDKNAEQRKLLYYPRGLVDIRNDRVFEFNLLTEQELDARIKRKQQERLAKERELAELERLMLEEAAAEVNKIKEDPNFELQPPAKRVAFWKQFQRRYPGAPLDDESWQKAMVEYNAAEESLAMEKELERLRAEAAVNDPGPKPRLSSKQIKRLKRSGQWKWGNK